MTRFESASSWACAMELLCLPATRYHRTALASSLGFRVSAARSAWSRS